jgi:hypothetical protein
MDIGGCKSPRPALFLGSPHIRIIRYCVCDWFIGLIDSLLSLSLCGLLHRLLPTSLFRCALLRRLRAFILRPTGPFLLSAEFRRHFYTNRSKQNKILLGIGYSRAIIRQLAPMGCVEI